MYTDTDDSDVEVRLPATDVVSSPNATATAENTDVGSGSEMVSPTFFPKKTGSTVATLSARVGGQPTTSEDTSIPESALCRTAILIDASMLGDGATHPERTDLIVEMAYRIIRRPLNAETRVNGHQSCRLWEPTVDAGRMQRREKNMMINSLLHRCTKVHGVGCFYRGVGDNNTRVGDTDMLKALFESARLSDAVVESDTFKMDVVDSQEKQVVARTEMKKWAEAMCTRATARCADGEKQLAFLTLRGASREEVRRALAYLQTELGVKMPPYRVFTLEDVLYGAEAHEDLSKFSEADDAWENHACVYHRQVALQEHGYRLRCCYWTITFIDRVLIDAAEQLELARESLSVAQQQAASAAPLIEDD